MKILPKFNSVLIFSTVMLALVPMALFAQQQDQDQRLLTLQEVKDRLNQNGKYIKDAQKHGKAGDAAGTQVALDNYARSTEGLDRALNQGQFQGDESQRVEALERVDKATRKQGEVLAGLLDKVPDQAKPAIQHAMVVSQQGRITALAQLSSARTERDAAVARRQAEQRGIGNQPGTTGRPSGIGQPGAGRPTGRGGRP